MIQRVLTNFTKFLLVVCLCANVVYAATPSVQNPQAFVQGMVTSLQNQIEGKQEQLVANPNQLYAIIRTTVMPCVDINRMAGLALGPKWRTANPTEQQDFINAFGLLLTRTYANAIVKISDYEITVSPIRGNDWQSAQYVAVNGTVTSQSNGQKSNLTYYLERSGNSWKIYDLAIEGVSFLKNYQSQFQTFNDMNSLLAKLAQLNSGAST